MYNYLECQIYLIFFCYNFFYKEEMSLAVARFRSHVAGLPPEFASAHSCTPAAKLRASLR